MAEKETRATVLQAIGGHRGNGFHKMKAASDSYQPITLTAAEVRFFCSVLEGEIKEAENQAVAWATRIERFTFRTQEDESKD